MTNNQTYKPEYIKLVCSSKGKNSDGEVIFNLKEDLKNLWITKITEEHLFTSSFGKFRTFGLMSICIKEKANKMVPNKNMMLFDYLKSILGIWYIEYLDEDMNLIERITSPYIPCYDDQNVYKTEVKEDGSLGIVMKG